MVMLPLFTRSLLQYLSSLFAGGCTRVYQFFWLGIYKIGTVVPNWISYKRRSALH